MSKDDREVVAGWLTVVGAVGLFASLFLTWSHQLSPELLVLFGKFDPLRRVPLNPTAWQVYAAADVALALLAAGLLGLALVGSRGARVAGSVASLLGLGFTLHALAAPPSNGAARIFRPDLSVPSYISVSPAAGIGETVAIVALLLALGGLALSFTAD